MKWNILDSENELEAAYQASFSAPVVIFKHSTRCIISKMALRQFESDFRPSHIVPYFLDLLQFRGVSNKIEERFGVAHQSPQVILIENGQPVYHASHESIDAAELEKYAQ